MLLYLGLMIPFLGTTLGSGFVFLLKNELKPAVEKVLLGFASGVMIAASVWSLLIPSIEMAQEQGKIGWLPASIGFMTGIIFLLVLDKIIPHLHVQDEKPEGFKAALQKKTMMILAVTLHNIPEGAVISMPLAAAGGGKGKSFLYGTLSGIVEPIGALLTILMTGLIDSLLPYILAFAAGAMIYVVVEELIPDAQEGKHSDYATIGVAVGFVLMMILDVALG
ncbi:MAG: ZIP family metal transporter [Erysipelotrichaceae bacterium]|nr:ZIP family metal transporter [Erysipelotrichaceae bacterium]